MCSLFSDAPAISFHGCTFCLGSSVPLLVCVCIQGSGRLNVGRPDMILGRSCDTIKCHETIFNIFCWKQCVFKKCVLYSVMKQNVFFWNVESPRILFLNNKCMKPTWNNIRQLLPSAPFDDPTWRSIKTKKITLNHLAHTIFAMVSSTRWAPDPVISGVMGLWGPYRWLSRLRTEVILPYLLGLFHLIYIWIRDPSCIKLG